MQHQRDVVNMVDVAQQAGVSIATVSRALRGHPEVSAATTARVREVAEELGYVVSPAASGLAMRTTRRVAVVVPSIDIWFYATMLAGIEETLRESQLDVQVYQVDGAEKRARFIQELPARRKADAVVLVAMPLRPKEERRLSLLGVPLIVAGGRIKSVPYVRVDERRMARLALDHLSGLGHERIAMIRTSDTDGAVWSSDKLRVAAWRQAVQKLGQDPDDLLVTEPAGPMAGHDAMARLWSRPDRPTAVLAFSDEIAVSALGYLAAHGVDVPGDVSVVGFDDNPVGEAFGLTTVSQSVRDQGRRVGALAAAVVQGLEGPDLEQVVPCELVVRSSTGPARQA